MSTLSVAGFALAVVANLWNIGLVYGQWAELVRASRLEQLRAGSGAPMDNV